jgi:hypothetical protein
VFENDSDSIMESVLHTKIQRQNEILQNSGGEKMNIFSSLYPKKFLSGYVCLSLFDVFFFSDEAAYFFIHRLAKIFLKSFGGECSICGVQFKLGGSN